MAVVKLQRLYDKIRFLPSGDGFRYQLGYPLVLKGGLLFLVWLFLLHDALAVSYTHLDVYKRQMKYGANSQQNNSSGVEYFSRPSSA